MVATRPRLPCSLERCHLGPSGAATPPSASRTQAMPHKTDHRTDVLLLVTRGETKMTHQSTIALASAALLAASTATAYADDFAPPPYRGGPLSVQAEWDFSTPFTSVDIFPEFFNAVGGSGTLFDGFMTKAELSSTSDWRWVPGDGDGGITPTDPGGGVLAFKVQNWIDLEIEKLLRIQVTHQGAPPNIIGMTGFFGTQESDGVFLDGEFVDDQRFYEDWSIRPNPWWEIIEVSVPFGTVLDQVVIDTISIPAPGVAPLFALAVAVPSLRRRRGAGSST